MVFGVNSPSGANVTVNVGLCSHFSETDEYVKAVYQMTDMINVRLTNFPFHNDLIFSLCKGLKYRKARQITHTQTGTI